MKNETTIIDRIGMNGPPTNDSFDYIAFLQNPVGYLSSIQLDVNDFYNITLRRGMLVDKGDPNFNSALDMLGNWYYRLNNDMSDIGSHTCYCQRPANTVIGFFQYETILPCIVNQTFDIPIVTGNSNVNFNLPPGTRFKMEYKGGDLKICNNSSYPYPQRHFNWFVYNTNINPPNSCTDYEFYYETPNDHMKVIKTDQLLNPTYSPHVIYELISNYSSIIVDPARNTTKINLEPCWLYSDVKDLFNQNTKSYPSITDDEIIIESFADAEYYIYDITGKNCSTGYVKQGINNVDVSNYSIGAYIIKVKEPKYGSVKYFKFLKK